MKAHTTLSVRSALTLAFAILLSATVATGCDDDEPSDETLQIGPAAVPVVVVQPSPAIQCQNGRLISVWTKANNGMSAAVPVRPGTDQECHPGQTLDASADDGASLAPGAPPAALPQP